MPKRHIALLGGLFLAIGAMVTLVSHSVTLYRLFCAATGAGGTTQRVAADTAATTDQTITVTFDTNTAPNLPWRFVPLQHRITVHLGEETPVFFEAENLSDTDIVGRATFNVTPDKAGLYFKKIECFCFTEERLAAHSKVQMPVVFFVDPEMAGNAGTRDVHDITLSYTFFRATHADDIEDLSRFQATAEVGGKLFASQCAACHALDKAKVGPPLADVVNRAAGSVPGYPYSHALATAGITWTPENLDRWLAGPSAMVPGVAMPMAIAAPAARAAIIAYLKQQSAVGGS
jgi:cytochrome c oxidase assembly protein Cox11